MRNTVTWLHISDIHFHPKTKWRKSITRDGLKAKFKSDEKIQYINFILKIYWVNFLCVFVILCPLNAAWSGNLPTYCGSHQVTPPSGVTEEEWSNYVCTGENLAPFKWRGCYPESSYTKEKGRGCPGDERCCKKELLKTNSEVKSNSDVVNEIPGVNSSSYLTRSGQRIFSLIFLGIAFILAIKIALSMGPRCPRCGGRKSFEKLDVAGSAFANGVSFLLGWGIAGTMHQKCCVRCNTEMAEGRGQGAIFLLMIIVTILGSIFWWQ